MVKFIQKKLQSSTTQYQSSLKLVEELVKKLKKQDTTINTHDAQSLNSSVQEIVAYMGRSGVIKQKAYSKSILILDNALILNKNLFFYLELSDVFMENLCKFFIRISSNIQNDNQSQSIQQKIENILYGCLYLILLLIYKAGNNFEDKNKIMSKIFTPSFIVSFTHLPVCSCTVKTIRIISMILAFLIKSKLSKKLRNQIKRVVLDLVYTCTDEASKIYLILIIKSIIAEIKPTQIMKYKVLDFILSCLQIQQQPQVIKNCLFSINFIVLNYRQFIDYLIKMRFMRHWDAFIGEFPFLCLKIFKIMLPNFSNQKKQSWFKLYLDHISQKQDQYCHVHIQIVNYLIKQLTDIAVVGSLQHNFLWQVTNRINNTHDEKMKMSLIRFKQSLALRLQDIDINLSAIYLNTSQRSLNFRLEDLH